MNRTVVWVSESSPARQLAIGAGIAAVGLALVVGLAGRMSSDVGGLAGFGLGVLMSVLGITALLFTGRQRVTVDPDAGEVRVDDRYFVGSSTRTIAFAEIAHVGVGLLGKASDGVAIYYLVLTLRDGEEYPLFAPGRAYRGSAERDVVDGWRARLESYVLSAQ